MDILIFEGFDGGRCRCPVPKSWAGVSLLRPDLCRDFCKEPGGHYAFLAGYRPAMDYPHGVGLDITFGEEVESSGFKIIDADRKAEDA